MEFETITEGKWLQADMLAWLNLGFLSFLFTYYLYNENGVGKNKRVGGGGVSELRVGFMLIRLLDNRQESYLKWGKNK